MPKKKKKRISKEQAERYLEELREYVDKWEKYVLSLPEDGEVSTEDEGSNPPGPPPPPPGPR